MTISKSFSSGFRRLPIFSKPVLYAVQVYLFALMGSAVLADEPGTDARCYSAQAGTIAGDDWAGCADMLIVDRSMLTGATAAGSDRHIVHDAGTPADPSDDRTFSFGNNGGHGNVFTG